MRSISERSRPARHPLPEPRRVATRDANAPRRARPALAAGRELARGRAARRRTLHARRGEPRSSFHVHPFDRRIAPTTRSRCRSTSRSRTAPLSKRRTRAAGSRDGAPSRRAEAPSGEAAEAGERLRVGACVAATRPPDDSRASSSSSDPDQVLRSPRRSFELAPEADRPRPSSAADRRAREPHAVDRDRADEWAPAHEMQSRRRRHARGRAASPIAGSRGRGTPNLRRTMSSRACGRRVGWSLDASTTSPDRGRRARRPRPRGMRRRESPVERKELRDEGRPRCAPPAPRTPSSTRAS